MNPESIRKLLQGFWGERLANPTALKFETEILFPTTPEGKEYKARALEEIEKAVQLYMPLVAQLHIIFRVFGNWLTFEEGQGSTREELIELKEKIVEAQDHLHSLHTQLEKLLEDSNEQM